MSVLLCQRILNIFIKIIFDNFLKFPVKLTIDMINTLKEILLNRQVTVSSVHKKHSELVHLLKSGGERGVKGVKVTDY